MSTTNVNPVPIDDGDPAFPAPDKAESDYGKNNRGFYSGMSLRDYFAGQAIAGCLPGSNVDPGEHARWAYRMADAMLRARKA